jgi:hypothetical protein
MNKQHHAPHFFIANVGGWALIRIIHNLKPDKMSKKLELSSYEAEKRLLLFLKLRKGKSITEGTIKDFQSLINKLWGNFKDHDSQIIGKWQINQNKEKDLALRAIRCQFMKWENGGNCRLVDIEEFSFYKDQKYRAKVKGELKEISEQDHNVLQYIFFGEK